MFLNTNKFREAAISFQTNGVYTTLPKTSRMYKAWWREERRRCLEGYTAPDGDYITGYHYFYLNYCPIMISVPKKDDKGEVLYNEDGTVQSDRIRAFPRFWDGDHQYFMYLEAAEKGGKHAVVLKTRGRGYSYKGAAMLCRNYFLIPQSKSYAIADQSSFLGGEDGILSKAWDQMSFIDEHTAWSKKRHFHDTTTHRRASYKATGPDGVALELGFKSEIIGVTLKNDPHRARGKRGKLILFEEAGKMPALLQAWQIARPSVEQGSNVFGLMVAFGCVCRGTKVWTKNGDLLNIEDLTKDSGIIGYKNNEVVINDITHFNPPFKTQCYKITTNTGRVLECSADHPILYSTQFLQERFGNRSENKTRKKAIYKRADQLSVGDQVAVLDHLEIFGTKKMWNPRVVGWLIGDGSYGLNKTPVLSNCEPEINGIVNTTLDSVIEKSYKTKTNKVYQETRIRGICAKLRELGIYGQTKLNKTLPNDVHKYTKQDLCELVGGLFDTDGYVNIKGTKCEISITSASKTLLSDILVLLNKLGIHSTIIKIKVSVEKNPKNKNDYYRLIISDKKSLLTFSNLITLYPKVKKERLALIPKVLADKQIRASDHFPNVRFERIVSIEDIGVQEVFNLTAGTSHTYIANGIITHNTGGAEGADFDGLSELFDNPRGYNILPQPNIWDENKEGTECGFFMPEYMNLEDHYDQDGNSNIKTALEVIATDREVILKHTKDKTAYKRYVAEKPINTIEARMKLSGNIFPTIDLIGVLAKHESNPNYDKDIARGFFELNPDGSVEFVPKPNMKLLLNFPHKQEDDVSNCPVMIFQPPVRQADGVIPHGLYIAGIDPYDHDQSTTSSLGSTIVMNKLTNQIVAEYTGRPNTAKEYYEQVRRLLIFYNARALYESERKGIFDYFEYKQSLHLLTEEPFFLKDIIKNLGVSRKYGLKMTDQIKRYGEGLINTWLLDIPDKSMNLTKIPSIGLLKELINYDPDPRKNYDRVMALVCLMYQLRAEMSYTPVVEESRRVAPMSARGMFARMLKV